MTPLQSSTPIMPYMNMAMSTSMATSPRPGSALMMDLRMMRMPGSEFILRTGRSRRKMRSAVTFFTPGM